ncbi:MAG: FdtA/QdtA family cupin domain-containing protein [Bacteroidaceae bacterium]|nr:FdtA/QdtA family cupin domain-containing protein [Bacteroidaceae bacterium]MBQ6694459.1 FdtA/QdtA family cupin domain-containing protein [Bacteroidaceae bacterium]MBR7166608.1 FdtA/QdtA family cupin domain-containing protein [Bacteroidaceae bacterium]
MKRTTVDDCRTIELGKHHGATGNLTAVENGKTADFDAKRVFFIYDIPGGVSRGGHAHKTLHELIIAVSGSFDVYVHDGNRERSITLNHPSRALFLPHGVWEELRNFSSGAVALVLASTEYRPEDYIRDFDTFLEYKREQ